MSSNLLSFGRDDGTGFINSAPVTTQSITTELTFRIAKVLADGALFIPRVMEHKWALYYTRGKSM